MSSDHDDMLSVIIQFYFQVFKHYVFLSNPTLNYSFIIFIRYSFCISLQLFHHFCFNPLLFLNLNLTTLDFILQRLYVLKVLHKLHPLLILTILNFHLREHFIFLFDLFVKCLFIPLFQFLYLFGTSIDIKHTVLHLESVEFFLSLQHFPFQIFVFLTVIQYFLVFLFLLVFITWLLFEVF